MSIRPRTVAIGIGALAVLGAAAATFGPRLYRDLIVGEQPAAPTLSNSHDEAPSAASSSDAGDGEWRVGSGSFAGYRVDEILNGLPVTVVGRSEDVSGGVVIEGGTLTSGSVSVGLDSVATDEAQRDKYFRGRALQTDQFPTASFTVTEPVPGIAQYVRDASHQVSLAGQLSIHGVTQDLVIDLQAAPTADGGVEIAGSIPITFEDFGVTPPNLGFVKVEDHGTIEVSLKLARA